MLVLAAAFYFILLPVTSSYTQEDPFFSDGNSSQGSTHKFSSSSKEGSSKKALEEAKVLAQTFKKTGYILPPRSISDLQVLLAPANNPKRQEKLQALRKHAYSKQPKTLSGRSLAVFLTQRAGSLADIGQAEESLREYRNLIKLIENKTIKLSPREKSNLYMEPAYAEIRSGSFRKGIALGTISANARMNKDICMGALLASFYSQYGALAQAEKWMNRSYLNFNRTNFSSGWWKERDILEVRACYYQGVASVEHARGKYHSALISIESANKYSLKAYQLVSRSYSSYGPVKNSSVRGLLYGMMLKTKILLQTNKNIEAELNERHRLKIILENWGVNSERTIGSLHNMAHILISQGRTEEARDIIIKAQEIWKIIGTSATSSRRIGTLLLSAEIHTFRREWDKALLIYKDSIKHSRGDIDFITYDPNYILTLIQNNKLKKAKLLLEISHEELITRLGKKNRMVAELSALLAMTFQALGKTDLAINYFENYIPILLSRSRQSVDDTESASAKDFRVSIYLESYISTLLDTNSQQHITTAFLLADTARGSSVRSALHKYGDRLSSGDSKNNNLIRQEQDIQKQISALYGLLTYHASLSKRERDKKVLSELRRNIDKLRDLRAVLILEIEKNNPNYKDTRNKTLTIQNIKSYLSDNEAIISFYVGENYSVVWVLNNSSNLSFHKIDIKANYLKSVVEVIRHSLNSDAQTLDDIPEFPIALTYNIYQKFLHPLENLWKNKKHLQVITHKSLSHLPLSLLTTKPHSLTNDTLPYFAKYRDVPWLVKSHSVTVLPSLDSIPILRQKRKFNTNRLSFIGFADPIFHQADPESKQHDELVLPAELDKEIKKRGVTSRKHKIIVRSKPHTDDLMSATLKDLPQLPDTREEVRNMAVAMGAELSRDVFFGSEATESRVKKSELKNYRIVAFATHGLVAGDLDGLNQPAIALSSPEISKEEEDGLLTMGEIMGLRLEADWVVLSACNTGSGKDIEAEAISGLGRAFLYSGAKALLVSNWPVETTSARMLTTDIFERHVASPLLRKSEALRQAMLALVRHPGYNIPNSAQILFTYAHPLFWAPFSLVGHGGVIRTVKD